MLPHITVQERLVLKALGIDDCSDTGSGAAGWARDTAAAAPGAGRVGAAVGSSGMPYVQGGAAAGGGAMPGARGGAASGGRGVPCRQGGAASGGTGIPVHRDWSHASQLEPGQQLQPGLQPCARSSGPGSGPAPNWAPRPASADDARNWRDQATPGARAFADMAQGRGLGDGVAGWAEGGREEGWVAGSEGGQGEGWAAGAGGGSLQRPPLQPSQHLPPPIQQGRQGSGTGSGSGSLQPLQPQRSGRMGPDYGSGSGSGRPQPLQRQASGGAGPGPGSQISVPPRIATATLPAATAAAAAVGLPTDAGVSSSGPAQPRLQQPQQQGASVPLPSGPYSSRGFDVSSLQPSRGFDVSSLCLRAMGHSTHQCVSASEGGWDDDELLLHDDDIDMLA